MVESTAIFCLVISLILLFANPFTAELGAVRVSPSWVTFLFEAANFLLLAAVLGWLFFRPVRGTPRASASRVRAESARPPQRRGQSGAGARRRSARGAPSSRARSTRCASGCAREAESERARLLEAARAQTQRERETLEGRARSSAAPGAGASRWPRCGIRRPGDRRTAARGMEGPDLEQALLRGRVSRARATLRPRARWPPSSSSRPARSTAGALDALAEAAGMPAPVCAHASIPSSSPGSAS